MASTKRQLLLPGLPRSSARRSRPFLRAKRDFTAAEFAGALVCHDFRQIGNGLRFVDITGRIPAPIEGVYLTDPARIARRATLAKLLRERSKAE